MSKIWMLASANLRKSKTQTFSLLLFILIAAMVMNIGLVIALRMGSFYDEQAERNHAAHLTGIYAAGARGEEEGHTYLSAHPDVTEIETITAIGSWGSYAQNDLEAQSFLILATENADQKIEPISLIGGSRPLTGNAIYLPYFMMQSGGYRLGDEIKLSLSGVEISFSVAGATEEIMFGAQMNAYIRCYISEEYLDQLMAQMPQNVLSLLSARINDVTKSSSLLVDYQEHVSAEGSSWVTSYDIAKNGHTMIPLIAAAVVVVFAVVLLLISLVVIRFRIINSVEDSMTNIGTQKAIGFRSVQIIMAIVLQFSLITLVGGGAGIAVSQILIPAVMKIWEPILGLVWYPVFDLLTALFSIMVVWAGVFLVSYLSARRINRLHPLIALRGGMQSHSFSKNRLPLDRTGGSLNLLLALKQVLHNKKQTVAVSLIVAIVAMASVLALTLSYNLNDRRLEFSRSIFGEVPYLDVYVMLKEEDNNEFAGRLAEFPEVRKAFGFTMSGLSAMVNDIDTVMLVAEDCSLLESNMLLEGRYPRHQNEIALGAWVSEQTGSQIGDMVTVSSDTNSMEYMVTGIIQITEGNGLNGLMNVAGVRSIQPDYRFYQYAVYLQEGIDPDDFIRKLEESEGDIFETVINEQYQISVLLDSVSGIFTVVTAGIYFAAFFVIILVLYMIIKTMILKRRRALGVQKALGFTTFQLMNQIALHMTPMILLGTGAGTLAGYLGASSVITMFFRGMGIRRLHLFMPTGQIVVVNLILVLAAYAISLAIARRIRKISAYALVTE